MPIIHKILMKRKKTLKNNNRKMLYMTTAEDVLFADGKCQQITIDDFNRLYKTLSSYDEKIRFYGELVLAAALRFLFNTESIDTIGQMLYFTEEFLQKYIRAICEMIYDVLQPEYLKLPQSRHEWQQNIQNFNEVWHSPHTLGIVSHFYYQNVFVLAVHDAHHRFQFVSVNAQPKSFSEFNAEIVRQRSVKNIPEAFSLDYNDDDVIKNNNNNDNGVDIASVADDDLPYYFVGNETCPLAKHLMTPFPSLCATPETEHFNTTLEFIGNATDNAFGNLVSKFGVLREAAAAPHCRPHCRYAAETNEWILKACFVLFNFFHFYDKRHNDHRSIDDVDVSLFPETVYGDFWPLQMNTFECNGNVADLMDAIRIRDELCATFARQQMPRSD